ncbi:MAG: cadherin-like beta sandwich domain-containing protein [Lachnospiraceae bacterium]|nr:cadherin-like beta sandwich domain-containing protein [Lachnospiraceae bacterium]
MKTKKTDAGIRVLSDRRQTSVAVLKLSGSKRKTSCFLRAFSMRTAAAVFLAMLVMLLLPGSPVSASSCKIVFSASQQEVKVDEELTVELTIEGDVVPGIFEGYISYDPEILEYVSGPECIAGGEGTLRISDMGYDYTTLARSYSMRFKALQMGSCEFSMRGNPEIYEADLGFLMSVSSKKLTVNVTASKRASSDASLGLIRVNPGELEPAFSSTVYEYNVHVPNDVTEIYVSAPANDTDASVKIEGGSSLSVGQNRILIIVTAQDGTIGKYVIYVTRAEEESGEVPGGTDNTGEGPDNGNGDDPGTGDGASAEGWVFYAEDDGQTVFINTGARYKVSKNIQDVVIPEGYDKTSINISGHKITAYVPSNEPASEFLILVLEKDGESPQLYSFDRTEKTLQRLDQSRIVAANKTGSGYSTIEESELVRKHEKSLNTMTMVIAILSGICMLLLIIVIRMAMKSRNELD